jgi:hypothetical protein
MAPGRVVAASFGSDITSVIVGHGKVFVQSGATLYRMTPAGNVAITGLVLAAPVVGVVTMLDTRVCTGTAVYKIVHGTNTAVACTVGIWPGPDTSSTFSAMPVFTKAFEHGGALVVASDAFLQFSEVNAWDCFGLADTFVWAEGTITDVGHTPGCIVIATALKTIILTGRNKSDFKYDEYPVVAVPGSMASGYVTNVGFVVTFLTATGVFSVDSDGKIVNATPEKVTAATFDKAFTAAAICELGYFAYHAGGCVHFSYHTGGFFMLVNNGVTLASEAYVAVEKDLCLLVPAQSGEGTIVLVPNDFGVGHLKRIGAIHLSGVCVGSVAVTVQSDSGAMVTVTEEFTGLLEAKRFQGFSTLLSNAVRITISFVGEYFTLRSVQAVIITTARYK